MAHIKTEKEYAAIMSRIDQLFFETNEDTPVDDPYRLTCKVPCLSYPKIL